MYHSKVLPLFFLLVSNFVYGQVKPQPNIVFIIADDLGFNDVSFRGSNQIPTPNIDALAFNGVVLDKHYVLPTCTPSRTAILTGLYPIRTGMQGYPLKAGEPRGLPLNLRTLPERLVDLGYHTNLVGKWHQGFYRTEYTPTRRGFKHHLGYWNGYMSYFSHEVHLDTPDGMTKDRRGFDLHLDAKPAWKLRGKYATHLFTEHSEEIIANHDLKRPLFLQIAHLATHAGLNGTVLEVPDEAQTDARFSYILDPRRRRLAGIIHELDQSVGRVVNALYRRGILNNTIIVFIADNGGETNGLHRNSASNWPLRGQKWTVYEGGVRGVAAIWSPALAHPGTIRADLMHATDWLPTFYQAAGGKLSDLGSIDGVSHWDSLTGVNQTSPRSELLVNIDVAGAFVQNRWKIIRGEYYKDLSGYSGDSGLGENVPEYNETQVLTSPAAVAIATVKLAANSPILDVGLIRSLRRQTKILGTCRGQSLPPTKCQPYCLYDLENDPCESTDVSATNLRIGQDLLTNKLQYWDRFVAPLLDKPVDEKADPAKHSGVWIPWLDDSRSSSAHKHTSNILTFICALLASSVICR